MNNLTQNITLLRALVEKSVGRRIATSNDFVFLAGAIQGRINKYLSVSTLKRIWGYVDGYDSIRQSTLDILAHFVGYSDYNTFENDYCMGEEARSSYRVATQILNSRDVPIGARVVLEWNPNRRVEVMYRGDCSYIVENSEGSKVVAGDTFSSECFVLGQSAILSNFVHRDGEPTTFVIGNRGGITRFCIVQG